MDEEWKVIEFAPDYQVSNWGRVKRLSYSSKPRNHGFVFVAFRRGYSSVQLQIDGHFLHKYLSRIVLTHFGDHKLVSASDNLKIEFIDGNLQNCRIDNLRWINRINRGIQERKHHTSKYRGVYLFKGAKKFWRASITKDKQKYFKYFPYTPEGEIEAAKWRDNKSLELVGLHAYLNFPKETSDG